MSFRSDLIIRRTYNRPLNEEGTIFETWSQTVDRVIEHQKWLWERQLTINKTGALKNIENSSDWVYLNDNQLQELNQLKKLILNKKASVAGRTLWLGGTDVAKKRASSQFNCSFLDIETINDLVDAFWLLLQGCGVGFKPKVGTLTGFNTQIKTIETIPSKQNPTKGRENNEEIYDTTPDGKHHWYLSIGDSAEAWAKSVGKLLAMKKPVDILTIDFSEIRKEGTRLKGYGWISQGYKNLEMAILAICNILNKRADSLLSAIDILDIVNWLGTVLSSRRSAQIALLEDTHTEATDFMYAKKEYWTTGNVQRAQSNNSIEFTSKPSKEELHKFFDAMIESGGSEPGAINSVEARRRAPYFRGVNPLNLAA